MTFQELVAQSPRGAKPGFVIAFDPGETTGVAVFNGDQLEEVLQLKTKTTIDFAYEVGALLDQYVRKTYQDGNPAQLTIVHEIYRVYKWKADDHVHNALQTARNIGSLETLCHQRGLPIVGQSAQNAKAFSTDDKLKEWGFWNPGLKHGRDAIRHAAYFLIFGKPTKQTLPN